MSFSKKTKHSWLGDIYECFISHNPETNQCLQDSENENEEVHKRRYKAKLG